MNKQKAIETLRDYIERSTHWQEGGATRHDAIAALRLVESFENIKGVTDTGDHSELLDALGDALAKTGNQAEDWVHVGRGFVSAAIDQIEYLNKGLNEWRELWMGAARQNSRSQAALKIATAHLHEVLNKARTHAEQVSADASARNWLESIGSESK